MAKMRILVVSDSHGKNDDVRQAIEQFGEMDMFIHLGDIEGDEEYIRSIVPCAEENIYMVAGNCDYNTRLPYDQIIDICGYKTLLTHGHHHYVGNGVEGLDHIREFAIANGIDIVMFGHIHVPVIEVGEKCTLICPGSISYPRQSDRKQTFLRMEIDDQGKPHYSHGYLRSKFGRK